MSKLIGQDESGFAQFWSCYPRKQARKDALKAWGQVNGNVHLDDILAALAWQTQQTDWIKEGGQYVPLAATYLRGERWTDSPPNQPQLTGKTARTLAAAARWAGR